MIREEDLYLVELKSSRSRLDITEVFENGAETVTLTRLKSNVTYTAWIAPGEGWDFSYAALGRYDGTTGGEWNSSTGTNQAGVTKLKIGHLTPGVGSCLMPKPNTIQEGQTAPAPTSESGQANWGNVDL